jgi:hypothetical protein
VDLALEADVGRAVAGGDEAIGVLEAFVAQRIEAGGQHERRRQPRQVGMEQRRRPPVEVVRGVGDVVVVVVVDRLGRQQIAVAVLGVRRMAAPHVGRRIDQQLVRDRQGAAVARRDRYDRREVAAGAVAANREPRRVDAELARLPVHPCRRGDAVVDRSGKAVLGTHPVVDRDDDRTGAVAELAAEDVVGVEVADRPAAAVVVDERGQRARLRRRSAGAERPVDAQRNRAVRAFAARVDHGADVGRRRLREEAPVAVERSRIDRRQRVHRRQLAFLDQFEQRAGVGVQHRCGS